MKLDYKSIDLSLKETIKESPSFLSIEHEKEFSAICQQIITAPFEALPIFDQKLGLFDKDKWCVRSKSVFLDRTFLHLIIQMIDRVLGFLCGEFLAVGGR